MSTFFLLQNVILSHVQPEQSNISTSFNVVIETRCPLTYHTKGFGKEAEYDSLGMKIDCDITVKLSLYAV